MTASRSNPRGRSFDQTRTEELMTEAAAPKTHAEANRLRKDIVLGEATDEARLVRFVAGPDGVVVPDVKTLNEVRARLTSLGVAVADTNEGLEARDPSNNLVKVSVAA